MGGTSEGGRKAWLKRRVPTITMVAPDGVGRVMHVVSKGCEYVVRFDECDRELVESRTWFVYRTRCGIMYAATHCNQPCGRDQVIRMHRLLTGATKGSEVDHRNGNGLDNRRANLRVCSHAENTFNKRIYRNNHTGFKGVAPARKRADGSQRYCARIQGHLCKQHIGTFATAEEAARAYDRAAIELHGEFAHTNFPREDYE